MYTYFWSQYCMLHHYVGTSPARSHLSIWSVWEGSWLRPPSGGANILHPVRLFVCYSRGHYLLLGQERECTGHLHCCQGWRLVTLLLLIVFINIFVFECMFIRTLCVWCSMNNVVGNNDCGYFSCGSLAVILFSIIGQVPANWAWAMHIICILLGLETYE